jgi:hypothetical protein
MRAELEPSLNLGEAVAWKEDQLPMAQLSLKNGGWQWRDLRSQGKQVSREEEDAWH